MNSDNKNVYNDLKNLFNDIDKNYNIFEEEIDINIQKEYYEYVEEISDEIDSQKTIPSNIDKLFSEDIDIEEQKKLLVLLSNTNKVEAFRIIEKFTKISNNYIRKWALIALQQSRMIMESSLLDEKAVYISTGLGGKGNKLRYFCVFFTTNTSEINKKNKGIFKNEIKFALKTTNSELEKIEFTKGIVCFKTLVPINVNIKKLFDKIIYEINTYGNLLKENMIITNVKSLSIQDIDKLLKKESVD